MVRRVFTATDPAGRSYFAEDGEARSVHEQIVNGLVFHELWRTSGPLASNSDEEDAVGSELQIMPDSNGTAFRVVELMPTTDGKASEMHATPTTDYNIILNGEVTVVLDTGQVKLRAGDILVQRGGRHGWRNDGPGVCVFASVMIQNM